MLQFDGGYSTAPALLETVGAVSNRTGADSSKHLPIHRDPPR